MPALMTSSSSSCPRQTSAKLGGSLGLRANCDFPGVLSVGGLTVFACHCAARGAHVDSLLLSLVCTCPADSWGSFRANLRLLILFPGRPRLAAPASLQ